MRTAAGGAGACGTGGGGAAIGGIPIMVLCSAGGAFAAGAGAGGAFSAGGGGAMGLKPIMVFFDRLSVGRAVAPGTVGDWVVRAAKGAGACGLAIGAPH